MLYRNEYNRFYSKGNQIQTADYVTIIQTAVKFKNLFQHISSIAQQTKFSKNTVRKYLNFGYCKARYGNPHSKAVVTNQKIINRVSDISWTSRDDSKVVSRRLYQQGVPVSSWNVSRIRKEKLNFSFRKASTISFRRGLPINQAKKEVVKLELSTVPPCLLVVLDEVHFSNKNLCY